MNYAINILESPEYGGMLQCGNAEVSDELEDYLTEKCYVFFDRKFDIDTTIFYFGQASSIDKITELYNGYIQQKVERK